MDTNFFFFAFSYHAHVDCFIFFFIFNIFQIFQGYPHNLIIIFWTNYSAIIINTSNYCYYFCYEYMECMECIFFCYDVLPLLSSKGRFTFYLLQTRRLLKNKNYVTSLISMAVIFQINTNLIVMGKGGGDTHLHT